MYSQNELSFNNKSHHHSKISLWREKYKNVKPVTDEEFLLNDRLTKIKSVVETYGENNFSISYSGGKDSVVLSNLVDMAVPGNNIPRVYVDTGIDLNMIRQFVYKQKESDSRITIIQPKVNIKVLLETDGYPFKSKPHSHNVERYQRIGMCPSIEHYLSGKWGNKKTCPKVLRYQFTDEFVSNSNFRISDHCCLKMKEEPIDEWSVLNNKPYSMVGIMPDEGGRREHATCLAFENGKLKKFQPLVAINKAWEEWFIEKYHIEICDIYKPPYNQTRTGCKGCPFALHLQEELEMLAKYFPAERRQCELIWKPVYDEYRRLGYRLKDGIKSA